MKPGTLLTRRRLCLVAMLIAGQIPAAEKRPTRILHPPPETAASVAATPTATDAGSNQPTNTLNQVLPPLPAGVAELKFSELFRQPVGPRGLELTEKLRALDGKRVRIAGYMVRQSQPLDRCLLLSPMPVTLHEDEYGFAEDMPATVLHVFTDPSAPEEVPFTPGVLLLSGTLNIGNRVEADGRVSVVRLQLDPPTAEQRAKSEAANSAPVAGRRRDHKH